MKRPSTWGVLLLGIWLIVTGLSVFGLSLHGPLAMLHGLLALVAGILILIGR